MEGVLAKAVVSSIGAGIATSCAADERGTVWTWGLLQGEGFTSHSRLPRAVNFPIDGNMRTVAKIQSGYAHSILLVKEQGIVDVSVVGSAAAAAASDDSSLTSSKTPSSKADLKGLKSKKLSSPSTSSVALGGTQGVGSNDVLLLQPKKLQFSLDTLRASPAVHQSDPKVVSFVSSIAGSDSDVCAEIESDPSLSLAHVFDRRFAYAEAYLGKDHLLFVGKNPERNKIVAVLKTLDHRSKALSALVFNQYGIFPFSIDHRLVFGNGSESLTALPSDLGVKLLTFFINHGCHDRTVAGFPSHCCLEPEDVSWELVEHSKSRLPAFLLSLECRLGLQKQLRVPMYAFCDEGASAKTKDSSFRRFTRLMAPDVPAEHKVWNHFGANDAGNVRYCSWRGLEFVFQVMGANASASEKEDVRNSPAIVIFKTSSASVPSKFWGDVGASVAVVVEPTGSAEAWTCSVVFRPALWNFRSCGLSRTPLTSKSALREVVLANLANGSASAAFNEKARRSHLADEISTMIGETSQ